MAGKRFNLKDTINYPLRWLEPPAREGILPGWGQLPLLAIVMSVGIWFVAAGYNQARLGLDGGMILFWIGLTVVYLPLAVRLISKDLRRHEALGLMLVLSICTSLVNYLRSPLLFRGFDEFLHWRTTYDILQYGHLFSANSLLPVSPVYPGLEIITSALSGLGGISIINSGFIVLGMARIVILVSMFLIFERVARSTQVAGIACLLYTGNSTFVFFDGQYGYESLALPLAALAVYMLLRRSASYGRTYWVWTILIAAVLAAIVPTHHLTSYLLIAFLVLWTCTDLYLQWLGWEGMDPFALAAWLTFLSLFWISTIGRLTLGYLSPIISGAYNSLIGLFTGQYAARALFVNSAGQGSALFERMVAITSVLILGVGLLVGLWQWWLGYRRNSIAMACALTALIFPVLPIMRLSSGAWEVSNRLAGFIYVALAFIVAIGMLQFPLPARLTRLRQWIVIPGVVIVFLGGVISGSSPQTRLPSPYLPAAEERSIDSEGTQAAEWARDVLGPNNRMAADRTQTTIFGAYGTQRMVINLSDKVSISGLFLRYNVTSNDREIISEAKIHYLVVDRRITKVLPILGYYFESWEQLIVSYVPPVNISALEKFDHTKDASRIFDSGDIVIYDVGALGNAP